MIPLLGRANETRRKDGLLRDPKAVEIVESVNYRFDELLQKAKRTLRGAAFRTLIYDSLVQDLLEKYPNATVVELGCGLNTRFERIDNGQLRWFDLDVPDVYELWQQFFEETERRTFLPYSAFDDAWTEVVKKHNQSPYIFISEASVIYFPKENNQSLFKMLADFPQSHYVFDTATGAFIKNQDQHDALRLYNARLKWQCDDIKEIESWDDRYRVERSLSFTQAPEQVKAKLPWTLRWMYTIMDVFFKKFTRNYFINQVRFY